MSNADIMEMIKPRYTRYHSLRNNASSIKQLFKYLNDKGEQYYYSSKQAFDFLDFKMKTSSKRLI